MAAQFFPVSLWRSNAAVANAVYHATGRRIRELPIRLEKHFA